MMNSFCETVNQRKTLNLISNLDYSCRFSPSQTSNPLRAGFELLQTLASVFLNENVQKRERLKHSANLNTSKCLHVQKLLQTTQNYFRLLTQYWYFYRTDGKLQVFTGLLKKRINFLTKHERLLRIQYGCSLAL